MMRLLLGIVVAFGLSACDRALGVPNVEHGGIDASTAIPRSVGFVVCGTQSCDIAAGQVCCNDYKNPPHCGMDCSGPGDVLACDGAEDCPGLVCCVSILDRGSESRCRSTCGEGDERACRSDDECSAGRHCCPVNAQDYPGMGWCMPGGGPCG